MAPTHPALLDWLAVDFMESGWDMKAIQKKIVMSATYRQSSRAGDDQRKADPGNQWLARGPSARLTAEMLRDNVLKASGLLVEKIGGKSAKPYQPPDLWKVNNATYTQDTGEGLYRRSLYTVWKRSVPPPTMSIFDAPTRSVCTAKRQKTTTPLQALALLNDVQFLEAARVLASRTRSTGGDVAGGIAEMFVLLAGREPFSEELQLLEELYDRQLARFRTAPEKALGWLSAGEKKLDCVDCPEIAAGAVVASTIMNSDATIMRR